MRLYRSGSRWAFWRWTDVDNEYITRLHVLKTPWFAVCLHWINKPDPEPFLHDHPVSFLSIVLRGWYREERRTDPHACSSEYRDITRWNFVRASPSDRHTIRSVSPGGCLTLCLMGPKTREWGFHIPGLVGYRDQYGAFHPPGWRLWKDYYRDQRAVLGSSREAIQGCSSSGTPASSGNTPG